MKKRMFVFWLLLVFKILEIRDFLKFQFVMLRSKKTSLDIGSTTTLDYLFRNKRKNFVQREKRRVGRR